MDHAARCAFVQAQAACALAEVAAMQVDNQLAASRGMPPVWTYDHFMSIHVKYMIGHNLVIEYLRD